MEPNDPDSHHYLGVALGMAGQHDDAVSAFRTALSLDPDHADAKRNLKVAMESR